MRKSDKVHMDGKVFTVVWSTDDATPMQRLKAQIRCVRLMQWAGIPPVVPEHVALAERLRLR